MFLCCCELTYAHVDLVLLVGVHDGWCLAVGLERVKVDVWSFARGRDGNRALLRQVRATRVVWQILAVVKFGFQV